MACFVAEAGFFIVAAGAKGRLRPEEGAGASTRLEPDALGALDGRTLVGTPSARPNCEGRNIPVPKLDDEL